MVKTKLLKYNILLISIIGLSGFGFIPLIVSAQSSTTEARCWTKAQCDSADGIWGKNTQTSTDGINGCQMDGGDVVAGQCVDGSSSEGSAKCDDLYGSPSAKCYAKPPAITLQVPVPGMDQTFSGGLAQYIVSFYRFFVAAIAVMAVVMVMWGGFKRIYGAGSPEKIKDANDTIVSAISGLVIALLSYTLLNLVNPKLTNLQALSVAMVKKDTMGFCPAYSENKSLYDGGYIKVTGTCVGGTSGSPSCNEDKDCGEGGVCGNINSTQSGNPGSDTCGFTYKLNGRECVGMECSGTQGCFPTYKDTFPKYDCSNFFIQGKLAGIEVNYIDLVPICNSGDSPFNGNDGCAVASPNSSYANTLDVESNSSYSILDCMTAAPNNGGVPIRPVACSTAGGLKGYALLVEVESTGMDDWYAVDASTCNTTVTKRIKDPTGGDDDDPKAIVTDRLDFANVSTDKLFNLTFDSFGGIKSPILCDLSITREEFPDR